MDDRHFSYKHKFGKTKPCAHPAATVRDAHGFSAGLQISDDRRASSWRAQVA
jgi:hypothetical protein